MASRDIDGHQFMLLNLYIDNRRWMFDTESEVWRQMDGFQCKALRQKLGLTQVVLAWECQIDQAIVSKWEAGLARLRPMQVDVIRGYLAQRLAAAKQELAALELPELDIEQVPR